MNLKRHLRPIALGSAGVFAIATAFGTGNAPPAVPDETPLLVVDLSKSPVVQGRDEEMRAMLERILETEYCGDAMLEGVTQAAALNGEAPVDGAGFVKLAEEDWPAVLAEMTEEQFGRMLREGSMRADPEVRRLWNMLDLLGGAKEHTDRVLHLLRQMARQTTPEWDDLLLRALSCAWIHLTLERDGTAKALELGRYWANAKGVDSREFRVFVYALGMCNSFEECRTDEDRAEMARFMGEMSERCTTGETALGIDKIAAGDAFFHPDPDSDDPWAHGSPYEGVPGWVGSLQRRRMAERFLEWSPPRYSYDRETGVVKEEAPSPGNIEKMFATRAAAELAADEKDLTDLQRVYGPWPSENQVEEASTP